jgi:protein DJ-1
MTDSEAVRALVLLAQGAEEMEVVIVVDVLRRAGVDVVLAGLDGDGPVLCSRGVRLVPDVALDGVADGAAFDVVVLPGGAEGSRRLAESAAVGELLKGQLGAGRVLAAVCAAPTAFVAHGIGGGRRMTSHPGVREVVAAHCAPSPYVEDAVVEDGPIVTSRGPGTCFEFALRLVQRLVGDDAAAHVRSPLMVV